ncbi:MAG: LysM peptidoglycan-binding domain-containing protein [Desulfobacteraceae bacterium]
MERNSKAGKNTRKKHKDEASGEQGSNGASLLKKNELSIIFIGAGILTVIIFFIFFNPSSTESPKNETVHDIPSKPEEDLHNLKNRIDRLESMVKESDAVARGKSANDGNDKVSEENLDGTAAESYRQRLERLETALSVKLEAVNKRIDSLERNMAEFSDKLSSVGSRDSGAAALKKKVPEEEQNESMFHTVEKGDTLYSISRKYKTSVEQLLKINNLDKDSDIHPGDNLVIK